MQDSQTATWGPEPSCYTFHTWREHGIFPVEWYNPTKPGPGPDRYFSEFLDSFWRYMLETPKQQEVYQHYQYYEMDYDLVADFVYSKPLEQIRRFLQTAGVDWARPPARPECDHTYCYNRWRRDTERWLAPNEWELRDWTQRALTSRMDAHLRWPSLVEAYCQDETGVRRWPWPRPLPWEQGR